MINERAVSYISSLTPDNSEFCESIGAAAKQRGVPVIRREAEGFLKMLLALKSPQRILEIGTAVGYSAMIMAENTPKDCKVTTIEIGESDAEEAIDNFRKAGLTDRISLIRGDAGEVLPSLSESFDLVFLDAAKGQYKRFFYQAKEKLSEGGVILSDNVFQGGDILKPHFIIEQRDRTVHKRMREFLFEITHDEDFVTSIVPVGDGMAVSVLRPQSG